MKFKTIVRDVLDPKTRKKYIEEAAEIIKGGGLVAMPTETVYGLGANALDEAACAKIYAVKGRPSDNPLIMHISDRAQLDGIAADIPAAAEKLMQAFWPGPLTIVFERAAGHSRQCRLKPAKDSDWKSAKDSGFQPLLQSGLPDTPAQTALALKLIPQTPKTLWT